MPITVVLAGGFDDHDVEITAQGVPYIIEEATTSLLSGAAAEVTVETDGPGQVEIGVRIVKGHGAKADPQPGDVLPDHRQDRHDVGEVEEGGEPPAVQFEVPDGATLVLSYDARGLDGVVHTEPVTFD